MKFTALRVLALLVPLLFAAAAPASALSPYLKGTSVAGGSVSKVIEEVRAELKSGNFEVLGSYEPKGLSDSGVVVATDSGLSKMIASAGGDAIVGAGIRIGVKADGTVSYTNPDYWYRAYLGDKFDANAGAVAALEGHLKSALGAHGEFGGGVGAGALGHYHYMMGMEHFGDNRDLASYPNFDEAVRTIRQNLAAGVGSCSKVYEVVMPAQQIAVFGVAMNDPNSGDGHWVSKINGTENIAALPYEMFVVGGKVQALFGRYRIAAAYPSLKMFTFMKILSTPGDIKGTLARVAGAK